MHVPRLGPELLAGLGSPARLEELQLELADELRELFGPLSVRVYDFAVSGEQLGLPTLLLHCELALDRPAERRELVRRLAAQDKLIVTLLRPVGECRGLHVVSLIVSEHPTQCLPLMLSGVLCLQLSRACWSRRRC